jgi:hypothetical protein
MIMLADRIKIIFMVAMANFGEIICAMAAETVGLLIHALVVANPMVGRILWERISRIKLWDLSLNVRGFFTMGISSAFPKGLSHSVFVFVVRAEGALNRGVNGFHLTAENGNIHWSIPGPVPGPFSQSENGRRMEDTYTIFVAVINDINIVAIRSVCVIQGYVYVYVFAFNVYFVLRNLFILVGHSGSLVFIIII